MPADGKPAGGAWDDRVAAAVYPRLPDPVRHAIGQAVGRGAGAAHAADLPAILNVRPDPPDFRDVYYEPGLGRLGDSLIPEPLAPEYLRAQGDLGSCTGQALAAVVDILHKYAAKAWKPPVSERMLYEMARAHDEARIDGLDGSSLRGALKGFFHNGVCSQEAAPYDAGQQDWELTVGMARDARGIGLGGYRRLRHIADHWHAALAETGAVLASAVLHKGWQSKAVRDAGGRIVLTADAAPLGAHAFAVVGFTCKGFLVLNSEGPGWGGFKPAEGAEPLRGVALWAYEDWAKHVLDGWVLRLSARVPEAFRLVGGYAGPTLRAPRSTTPRIEINGHYVNLERGKFVPQGAYPSATPSLKRTLELLAEPGVPPRRTRLLLHFEDALDARTDMAARAAWLVPRLKARGVYPIVVMWAEGFAEAATSLLDGMAAAVRRRSGDLGAIADLMLEAEARRFLRPLWLDTRKQAEHLAERDARPALQMLLDLVKERGAGPHPLELHLSAYGAGAIALKELSKTIGDSGVHVESLHLLSPLCCVKEAEALPGSLRLSAGAAAVLNLDGRDAMSERCGPYGAPLAKLIGSSLEPEDGKAEEPIAALHAPMGFELWTDRDGADPQDRTHARFGDEPRVWNEVLRRITAGGAPVAGSDADGARPISGVSAPGPRSAPATRPPARGPSRGVPVRRDEGRSGP